MERVNGSTWKVRAYDVFYSDAEPSRIKSRVCFTVVKNPDSCFDGYSLAGFEVEETSNVHEWAQAYYDYLTTDPEGKEIFFEPGAEFRYNLIYVDDDLTPEIYVERISAADRAQLIFLSKGKVVQHYFSIYEGSYIPCTGLLIEYEDEDGPDSYYEDSYKLENGELILIGYCKYEMPFGVIESESYYLVGEGKVEKEQYEEIMHSYFGTAEPQSFTSGKTSQPISLLNFLKYLILEDQIQ